MSLLDAGESLELVKRLAMKYYPEWERFADEEIAASGTAVQDV